MHLPLLPSPSNSPVYVNGDVSIDASAAIAPGAIVRADPDSKIIIAAGVCIGMGVILHAHKGTLEVESGAILGAGVLVVGSGKIGANACIGAATTIWNTSVKSCQVVPPCSLLGDTGRQVAPNPLPTVENDNNLISPDPAGSPRTNQLFSAGSPLLKGGGGGISEGGGGAISEGGNGGASEATPSSDALAQKQPESPPTPASVPVYGQANLNRLLLTLFPHQKSANPPPEA